MTVPDFRVTGAHVFAENCWVNEELEIASMAEHGRTYMPRMEISYGELMVDWLCGAMLG